MKTSPTVNHLIEALHLVDAVVRRVFSPVGACRLGLSRADDLGFPDWAQSLAVPASPRESAGAASAPCRSHRSLEVI